MITNLPGFNDLVHDSQSTFRTLLNALSQPGTINQITVELTAPSRLNLACAATCLTLLDLETRVWLQPGLDIEVKNWLLFHTGCRFTADPKQADFAVIWHLENMPSLSEFRQGTPVYPEDSTTLLIQIETIDQSPLPKNNLSILKGAGINEEITLPINVPDAFWQQWQQNYLSYPLGVDLYLLIGNKVIGLPRTICVTDS